MLRWLLGLCIVAGIAAGLVLGALNPDPVTLDLAAWQVEAPLGAVVSLAALAGAVGGLLLALLVRLLKPRADVRKKSQTSMTGRNG